MQTGDVPWTLGSDQIRSVAQSCPTLCDPMNHSTPGLLVHHNSRSSLRLMSIESVMPSSHLILCHPLFILPPIPPSIRVFSNESTLRMRWPKLTTCKPGIHTINMILRVVTPHIYPYRMTGVQEMLAVIMKYERSAFH